MKCLSGISFALAFVVLGAVLLPSSGAASAECLTEYTLPVPDSQPFNIAAGPDGGAWFTWSVGPRGRTGGSFQIGRVTPEGMVTAFPLPLGAQLEGLTMGPDGDVWFSDSGNNALGRITPDGEVREMPLPLADAHPGAMTLGPDGALWVAGGAIDSFDPEGVGKILRVTPEGGFASFDLPASAGFPRFTGGTGHRPTSIVVGPDGALWFTEFYENRIGRLSLEGEFTGFPLPGAMMVDEVIIRPAGVSPLYIASGPDGALWFTTSTVGLISRLSLDGTFSSFPLPPGDSYPDTIIVGPDGALWFTMARFQQQGRGPSRIGRITVEGELTEYEVPGLQGRMWGMAAGLDGAIWFTEREAGKIGRYMAECL